MERVKIFEKNSKGHFKKGNPGGGRKLGVPNKVTGMLKTVTLEAAAMVGFNQEGELGLHGYLAFLAIEHPAIFGKLLEKCLPLQLTGSVSTTSTQRYETLADLTEALAARGLPPPRKLIDVTPMLSTQRR